MTYSEKTLKTVSFEDFTFDKEHGELRKRGRRIHLRPLAVRLLTILLNNAGSTVAREKLREALWGGRVVEWEMGLHRIAKEIRSALADDAREPRFIETVTRRGYRFCAPIESDQQLPNNHRSFSRAGWFMVGLLVLPGAVLTLCIAAGLTS